MSLTEKKNFRLSEKKTFATKNTRKFWIGTYFRWSQNVRIRVFKNNNVFIRRRKTYFSLVVLFIDKVINDVMTLNVKDVRIKGVGAHFSRQRHIEIMFLLKVRCYDLLCTEFFYAFSGRKLLNDLLQTFLCFMTGLQQQGERKKIPLVKCIMRLIMSSLHFSIFEVIYS